jgi:hypothetical protein
MSMKPGQTSSLETMLHRVEAELSTRIKALFGRCPELAGFAIQDLDGSRFDDSEETKLFVTDVGFSALVSVEEIDKVHSLIGNAIADVLSERPEAIELLRGRTFARTLH